MDERWKNVWAYVGPPHGYVTDSKNPEHEGLWQGKTEFLIEVEHEGMLFYSKHFVINKEMDLANLDIFRFVLDEMVEKIDSYMKEHGR